MLILLTLVDCWTRPEYWDADEIALEMTDHPNVWTDGNREDFSSVGGFEVARAGVYLPASELAFEGSVWGTVEECVMLDWSVAVFFCLSLGNADCCCSCHAGVLALSFRY